MEAILSSQILKTSKFGELCAAKKDEFGIYRNIPLFFAGTASGNALGGYDVDSSVNSIFGANSYFNKQLRLGRVRGESDHPDLSGLSEQDAAKRYAWVKRSEIDKAVVGVSKKALQDGSVIIFGDLKCCGPYGKLLEAELDDPTVDSCFSIRAILSTPINKFSPMAKRFIRETITWDTVNVPGFENASKRAQENLQLKVDGHSVKFQIADNMNMQISLTDGQVTEMRTSMATESQELLDALGVDRVEIITSGKVIGSGDRNRNVLLGGPRPVGIGQEIMRKLDLKL